MRVLVTGAAGFIGQALVPSLRADGFEPILLLEAGGSSHPSSGDNKPVNSALGTNYQADLRNRRQIAEIVKDCRPQKVIHLAAVGVTDPFLDYHTAVENNVIGTVNLLHACFDADNDLPAVKQLIIARTPGEASMMNVYAASKAAAWAFCSMYTKTRAWPIIGASIYQAYGSGQSKKALVPSAAKAALMGESFPMTSGSQQRDWIYVQDIAAGLIAVLKSDLPPGLTIDLGTGVTTTLKEVVNLIYKLAGRGGGPIIGALTNRPGEDIAQIADVNLTERLINWRARTPLKDGLTRILSSLSAA